MGIRVYGDMGIWGYGVMGKFRFRYMRKWGNWLCNIRILGYGYMWKRGYGDKGIR